MLNRRDLLRLGLTSAALLGPFRPSRLAVADAASRYLCDVPGFTFSSARLGAFEANLPVPPVAVPVRSDASGDHYEITMRAADVPVVPGAPTRMLTYDGVFPGPTIHARKGRLVTVRQKNQLDRPVTIHLHGGHVAPEMDGHPTALIPPGGSFTYLYPNDQDASTLWYHDHAMHVTGEHVYRGLLGLYLIHDPAEEVLGLPSGERDVPLVFTDRILDQDGQLLYPAGAHNGVVGDTMLCNGAPQPRLTVDRAPYRFRLLNGSNARQYQFVPMLDGQAIPWQQIASDGGLLSQPVERTDIVIAPAERVEVVIDFSEVAAGAEVFLVNLRDRGGTGLVRFDIRDTPATPGQLPRALRTVAVLGAPSVERLFTLTRETATGRWLLNGHGFDEAIHDAYPKLGATEVWEFLNDSPMTHPMHIHLVMFQVLTRNADPAPVWERGWKDTVNVHPGERVRVAVRFDGHTGTFVYHCHNLEHEDHDMMSQLKVVDLPRIAGAGRIETAAAVSAASFAPGVANTFIATAANFPDALAGGPAAAKDQSPVLLVNRDELPEATATELERLRPGRITVLGGPGAVSPAVEEALRSHTSGMVTRIGGESRFDTAAAISAAHFAPEAAVVYVATGGSFPDALAGGAAAAKDGAPVLLVGHEALPAPTGTELERLRPLRIVVLGGERAVSQEAMAELQAFTQGPVQRLAGDSRFSTAAAISRAVFPQGSDTVYVATGAAFPDALAGVPAAGGAGAPLLLVERSAVPAATAEEIRRLGAKRIVVLGGHGAISQQAEDALARLLP